ncbi:hypothetical protein Aph02nite_32900 [Actinoplanes philippinensis]|uniref:Uncharacterized protein n=1 Tax=Actinoplanes philippinensis TaxID=35752 RepID=A0A1I2E1H3_9ACTN|nr:ATP-binding protein [Actinoplanes philippinensis]GIE77340.1 hypothetical protein Aph02nite_32900 [Actinoplanes philippinensis]SFE86453.1 hypothetical protein SAMN05421541_104114 [Actinoplanes philippinensis]
MPWWKPNRTVVRSSGDATASAGGVAVSGAVGSIQIGGPPPARSAYREQVRRFAPSRLVGRDEEMATLVRFCTAPEGSGPYAWWRAPAWTGKSALMATFVLTPPAGVRVVSFFVTSRWAGQSDRVAFTDAVGEQLAQLTGQPAPGLVTEATRDGVFLDLLREASAFCRERGERLILVVDGLDEDRGVTTGADGHSIAALLPAEPPDGLRIIVAGRPDPPIPSDVPDRHPLRDPGIVRTLAPSAYAEVVREAAERELDRLADGTPAEQELLGLLTAARGGLSGQDLAELTTLSPRRIAKQLGAASARTFSRRAQQWRPDADVYLLGHEELQKRAEALLGPGGLARHRERLHVWAGTYRDRGWPEGTPEYLLRGYFDLLTETGDPARMVSAALDAVRHDRMLDLTGGDSFAVAEVTATQDELMRQPGADLLTMIRLARRRDTLRLRNANIPSDLPSLWARLGHPARAEALARAIDDPNDGSRGARAVHSLIQTLRDLGEGDRAESLTPLLKPPYTGIEPPEPEAELPDDADPERLLAEAYDPETRFALLMRLADALPDQAGALLDQAQQELDGFTDADKHWSSSISLAFTLVDRGELDRAESIVRAIRQPDRRDNALAILVGDINSDADEAWAESIVQSLAGSPYWQSWALRRFASSIARSGDIERALAIAERIVVPGDVNIRHHCLREYGDALSEIGLHIVDDDPGLAHRLALRAEQAARSTIEPYARDQALLDIARASARTGTPRVAAEIAAFIVDPQRRRTLAEILMWDAIDQDDHERARKLAEAINDRDGRLASLAVLARITGDVDHAKELTTAISDPEQRILSMAALEGPTGEQETSLARTIGDARQRARILMDIALRSDDPGAPDRVEAEIRAMEDSYERESALAFLLLPRAEAARAERIARSIEDPGLRGQALVNLAGLHVEDPGRVREILVEIPDPFWRDKCRVGLVGIEARLGKLDEAEAVIETITADYDRDNARHVVALAAAESGDHARATALAEMIDDPQTRAETLTGMSAHATGAEAHELLIRAARLGRWTTTLEHLPAAVIGPLADEVLSELRAAS